MPLSSCHIRKPSFDGSNTVGSAETYRLTCSFENPQDQWRSFVRSCVAALTISFIVLLAFPGPGHAQQTADSPAATADLIAGVPRGFPPHYIVEGDSVRGFGIDVMDEIARRVGIKVQYRIFDSWSAVNEALEAGDIDLVPNMGVGFERRMAGHFTTPYETAEIALFIRTKDDEIVDFGSLERRRVGIVETNRAIDLIPSRLNLDLQVFPDLESAIKGLVNKAIDVLAYPEAPALYLARSLGFGGRLKTSGPPLGFVERAVQVSKHRPDLAQLLDPHVRDFAASSKFDEFYRKWFVDEKRVTTSDWLLLGSAGAVVLVAGLGILAWLSYRTLVRKTADPSQRDIELRLWKRTVMIGAGLALVLVVASALAALTLYQIAFDKEKEAMQEALQGRASLISSIARFDRDFSTYPGDPRHGTLKQVLQGLSNLQGPSEVLLAERDGDDMVFAFRQLAPQRFAPRRIPMDGTFAEPMRRALHGEEGVIKGLDYRGQKVLAAYQPVAGLDMGIVIKRDISEIRAPFISAGWLIADLAITLSLICSFLYFRLSAPLVSLVLDRENQFRGLYRSMVSGVIICRPSDDQASDFIISNANPAAERIEGLSSAELVGRKMTDVFPSITRTGFLRTMRRVWESGEFRQLPPTYYEDARVAGWRTCNLYRVRSGELILDYDDVTEQIEASERLRVSEERFDLAMRGANDGLWDWDIVTDETYYSPRWKSMLGYAEDEIGNSFEEWRRLTHPSDIEHVLARVSDYVEGRIPNFENEFRMRHKDGHWVHILSRGQGVWNDAGECIRLIGTHTDITALRDAEKLLLQERNRFEQYLQLAGSMLVALDADGRILLVNRAACRILEYDESELLGANWFDTVIPAEQRDAMRETQRQVMEGDAETEHVENEVLTKSGARRVIRWHNVGLMHDLDAEGITTLSSGEDVTEMRRAEEELQQSRERYRELIETITDLVWEVDSDGIYTYVSPRAYELIGYRPEELVGTDSFDLVPDEDRARIRKNFGKLLANKEQLHGAERRFVGKQGQMVILERNAIPIIDAEGNAVGIRGVDRDITARKAAEEAFRREAEARAELTNIINRSPTVAVAWRNQPGWPVTFVSENVRQFGYTPEEFLSGQLTYAAIIHDDDRERIEAEVAGAVAQKRRELDLTYRIVTKSGEIRWVDTRIFDEEGTGTEGKGIILDITERTLASERAEIYLQTAGNLFVALDQDGITRRVNNRTCDMLGLRESDILGSDWINRFVAPDHLDRVKAYFDDIISGNAPATGEYESEILCAKSLQRTIRWYHTVLFNPDGSFDSLEAFGVDVTDQRDAELRVKEYAEFTYDYPNPVLRLDEKANIVLSNAAARDFLTNLSDKVLEGGTDADASAWLDLLVYARFCEKTEQREFHFGDRTLLFEIVPSPEEEGGRHTNLYATDITDLRATERRLQMAEKMEALGHLTGGIAHDFNNLLTVILGNLQLLKRQLADDEAVTKRLDRIISASESGAGLISRMMSFARQQVLEENYVDVNELVIRMEALLQRTMDEDIRITTSLSDQDCIVLTDQNRLENVILNLCINARDAMPDGGELTIGTARRTLDAEYARVWDDVTPGEYVEIIVSDTGIGMTKEVRRQIFEPFYTSKPKGEGTGLGLSTVFGFVKQSKGHVSVYSELGEGSAFKVYLPVSEEPMPARLADKAEIARKPRKPARILVVEDDQDVREFAVTALTDAGYQVLEAENGERGLDLFNGPEHVDLVFSDVVMPGGLSGPELAQKVRHIRSDIPVLLASGYAEQIIKKRVQIEGNADFLMKPYVADDLIRRVDKLLEDAHE